MKKITIILSAMLLAGLFFLQCKNRNGDIGPGIDRPGPEQIDKEKVAVRIMDTLSTRLKGRWNLVRVEFDIRHTAPTGSVRNDTTFLDFAMLDIHSISREEDLRYPVCSGNIVFRNQTWPVIFRLMPAAERIFQNTGPEAFTLLDWHFPSGQHEWKSEELFFRDLTLVGDNYSVQLNPDRSMTWKGLNHDVKEIFLRKLDE